MSKEEPRPGPKSRPSRQTSRVGARPRPATRCRPEYLEEIYRFARANREFQDVVQSLTGHPVALRGELLDRMLRRTDEQGTPDEKWVAALNQLRDPKRLAELVEALTPVRFTPHPPRRGKPPGGKRGKPAGPSSASRPRRPRPS